MGVNKEIAKKVKEERANILKLETTEPLSNIHYRPIGKYGEEKLGYIRKYLYIYSMIISKHFPEYYYVETHAGPGVCEIKESGRKVLGSPLLALTNEPYFSKYRFIEYDSICADSLGKRIKKYFPNWDMDKVCVIRGDCNKIINEVLREFDDNLPGLIIIDPENANQLKWTTLETCSKKKAELYITFPYDMDMKRYLFNIEKNTIPVTEFYGCDDWITIRDNYLNKKISHSEARNNFLHLFMNRIRTLLNYTFVETSDIVRGDKNQPLYYLIHASREKVARKTIREVMKVETKQITLDDTHS